MAINFFNGERQEQSGQDFEMFLKEKKKEDSWKNMKLAKNRPAHLSQAIWTVSTIKLTFILQRVYVKKKKNKERKLWLLCQILWLLLSLVSPPPVLGSVLKSAPQLDDKANYILDNTAKPQSLRRERKIKLLSSVWKLVSLGLKSEDAQSSWGDWDLELAPLEKKVAMAVNCLPVDASLLTYGPGGKVQP